MNQFNQYDPHSPAPFWVQTPPDGAFWPRWVRATDRYFPFFLLSPSIKIIVGSLLGLCVQQDFSESLEKIKISFNSLLQTHSWNSSRSGRELLLLFYSHFPAKALPRSCEAIKDIFSDFLGKDRPLVRSRTEERTFQ